MKTLMCKMRHNWGYGYCFLLYVLFISMFFSALFDATASERFVPTAPEMKHGFELNRQRVTVTEIIVGYAFRYWDGRREHTAILVGIDTPEVHFNDKAYEESEEWGIPVEESTRYGAIAHQFISERAMPGRDIEIEVLNDYGNVKTVYAYIIDKVDTYFDGECLNEIMLDEGYAIAPGGINYAHPRFAIYAQIEENARVKNWGFWRNCWKQHKKTFEGKPSWISMFRKK